ncbi:zinc carboxypeptidase-like [Hyposmocoma kahamanoa]|uniref:zinc carboxypeptidase-like n=1 Tax=Hyposmocoma kahamanoa TaxID=1477025 RepID=UPI000E6D754F|nr:zinc carboxypeptidase-like [Hyposmocoma kahamanoa]
MNLLKFIFLVISVVHFSQCAVVEEYKTYKDYKLFQVTSLDGVKDLIKEFMEFDDALVYSGNKTSAGILVKPDLVSIFEELVTMRGLNMELLVEDYSKIIEMEKREILRNDGFSWHAYHDVADIHDYLRNMSREYPNMTELIIGGQSYEGRQILGLRINSPSLHKKGKPVFFIESGIHAREWIAPATTTYFINELLTSSDPHIIAMRDQLDWHIFPSVNPDGYQYSRKFDRMWRKTRSKSANGCRGADPNRNWDYNWMKSGASSDPCDYQTYAGKEPFSEIETRSLSEYIRTLENLRAYVGFHSDVQMLLLPYSDSTEHMDNYDDLVTIGKTSLDYGYKVNREKYNGPATAAEILYMVSGGSMDWVRNTLATPLVYTYELRGKNFHWPPSRIPEQGDEVTQMMLGLVTEANNMGYFKTKVSK